MILAFWVQYCIHTSLTKDQNKNKSSNIEEIRKLYRLHSLVSPESIGYNTGAPGSIHLSIQMLLAQFTRQFECFRLHSPVNPNASGSIHQSIQTLSATITSQYGGYLLHSPVNPNATGSIN